MASTQFSGEMDTKKMKNNIQHLIEEDIVEPTQHYISKARDYGSKVVGKGSDFVKENPGYTILGAAAIGFLAGAYLVRRKS